MNKSESAPTSTLNEMESAFYSKDSSYDGLFFVAVRTTGIFCRPSCSARPKRENVEFFKTMREAIFAGYRPCKRCRPDEVKGRHPAWVQGLIDDIESRPGEIIKAGDLRSRGISPEKARRWFQENCGMTFSEWQRGRRLAEAFTQIRDGRPVDDVVFAGGQQAHDASRNTAVKPAGSPPGKLKTTDFVAAQFIETPLGTMLIAAVKEGVCMVEFSDRRMLEHNYRQIRKRYGLAVLPVSSDILEKLKTELKAYFQGKLKEFKSPLAIRGTPFQERVWAELRRIPYGQTVSYEDIAVGSGNIKAVRAVARANGMNRISILIPCHRVIGKDGELTGYGGGLWRKRLLIELERTGKLPGERGR
jgi:AraC family transcriptional regulator, regulatory protein of adaptative response / methylated-DNA-[protein]-cysteine methyltransferase